MALPQISEEQQDIINQLAAGYNVVVDSVAGSGKTTSILYIAKHFNNLNILVLTYNSKLRKESEIKANKLELDNIQIHTYHSFGWNYYGDKECNTDTGIKYITDIRMKPEKLFNFDLIILDEAQDIAETYYKFICKIYIDNDNENAKLCIFGDKYQSIFSFNQADQRYIIYAKDLFKFNSYPWKSCNLAVSFRLTDKIASFVNECLLKELRLLTIPAKKSEFKPRYIICDCYSDVPYNILNGYMSSSGYEPKDIFILAPSVRKKDCESYNSPVVKLENRITKEMGIDIYIQQRDEEKIDENEIKNKLVISTFHRTKGLERKVVIIFNFDDTYFEYYNTNANPLKCPNHLYVAATRASECLTVLHDEKRHYLPFINQTKIKECCQNTGHRRISKNDFSRESQYEHAVKEHDDKIFSVSNILNHLHESIENECFKRIKIIENEKYKTNKITINPKTKTINDNEENISMITGLAIPCMLELKLNNKITVLDKLKQEKFEEDRAPRNKKNILKNINITKIKIEEILYVATCWNSYESGYLNKLYQIANYNWINEEKFKLCINRLETLNISKNSYFEYRIEASGEPELLNSTLRGFIDCVDEANNIVYEFKCVQELKNENYLQLALYMYLYELEKRKNIIKLENDMKQKTYSEGDKIMYDKNRCGTFIKICKNNKIEIKDENNKRKYIANKYREKLESYKKETKYVLFNILTNEYKYVECEFSKLKEMVKYLIEMKYNSETLLTDEEFMTENIKIRDGYFPSLKK